MNKRKSLITGVILIVAVFIFVLAQNSKNGNNGYPSVVDVQPTDNNNTTSAPLETINPSGGTSTNTTPQSGVYSMSEVVKHNSKSDCWTTVNGGVYNVTSWISQHPGGQQAIIGLCGIDGSAAFNDQHGGQRRPANELASFKIGTLK